MCNSQQSCKCSMGGVSHLGQTTSEASKPVQLAGVSFTFWSKGKELVVLTTARRGCFCDGCSESLRAASRLLREYSVQHFGPFWDLDCEQDLFYHEIESPDSQRVLTGFVGQQVL